MQRIALIVTLTTAALSSSVNAEIYQWKDDKQTPHFSQLPPEYTGWSQNDDIKQIQMLMINQQGIPAPAAGGMRDCSTLDIDRINHLKRQIHERYVAEHNACDISHNELQASAAQREACYQQADDQKKQGITKLFADLSCTIP